MKNKKINWINLLLIFLKDIVTILLKKKKNDSLLIDIHKDILKYRNDFISFKFNKIIITLHIRERRLFDSLPKVCKNLIINDIKDKLFNGILFYKNIYNEKFLVYKYTEKIYSLKDTNYGNYRKLKIAK